MKKTKEKFLATRRSLLERLKEWDDQEGWKQFYDLYWQLIYGVGRRAGLSHSEAEDLVQETVVAVAKKIPGFKYEPNRCSFKSWLMMVTRSRLSNLLRKNNSRLPRAENIILDESQLDIQSLASDSLDNMQEIWEEEWAKNLMDQAIKIVKSQISSEQYQVFDLYVIKEMDARVVAETLGMSQARVYLIKHRVTKLIKKALKSLENSWDQ